MIQLKHCPICGDGEKWKYLDYLRDREYWVEHEFLFEDNVNFKICTNCGFLTYDYQAEEELARRYNMSKPMSGAVNILTQNRKNEYHNRFLKSINLPSGSMNILDMGAAEGGFLAFFEDRFSRDNLSINCYGVEFNKSSRAFGKAVYGYDLKDEIEAEKVFDFISLYKVIEHLQYPDQVLRNLITDHSNEKTYFYISIPIWGEVLSESSGIELASFEYYYHLNHVNVFTRQSFYNLLNKVGLAIIKEDSTLYGLTVLCRVCPATNIAPITKKNYENIIQRVENEKLAIDYFHKGDMKKAIEIIPSYADAYIRLAMSQDNAKDIKKQLEILMGGLKNTENDKKILAIMARLLFQWDENTPKINFYSNNIKKSETIFEYLVKNIGGNEDYYFFLGMIEGMYKKDMDAMTAYFSDCVAMNPLKWGEIYNNMGSIVKDD